MDRLESLKSINWLRGLAAQSSAPLSSEDFDQAAAAMNVPRHMLRAVASVESRGQAYGDDGRCIIAYEPHVFQRLTGGAFDKYKTISQRYVLPWKAPSDHVYHMDQSQRWDALIFAAGFDFISAVQSASWGLFQIMGFNHKLCGYGDIRNFLEDMYAGEEMQMRMWLRFLEAWDCVEPLRREDPLAFALRYNAGKNWRDERIYKNPPPAARDYAAKMARAARAYA